MVALGLDVGGANTKLASSDGRVALSYHHPLWTDTSLVDGLGSLRSIALDALGCEWRDIAGVGVVMTGEEADSFSSKSEGVVKIADTVEKVFPNPTFYRSDGEFKHKVRVDTLSFSAVNWFASAGMIAGDVTDNAIFVDVGSTTTDVIPIVSGEVPGGFVTDFQRLGMGRLLYRGVLRTNVAALTKSVILYGTEYGIASESFAITGDVYLLLEKVSAEDYQCMPPDHYAYEKLSDAITHEAAMKRIARVLCCDVEELGDDGILDIARQIYNVQVEELSSTIRKISDHYALERVFAAGQGEFLALEAAARIGLPCASASDLFNPDISKVFPAFAVAKLLERCL